MKLHSLIDLSQVSSFHSAEHRYFVYSMVHVSYKVLMMVFSEQPFSKQLFQLACIVQL